MKYTIEQINEAWIRFNSPMYLVKKNKKLEVEDIEQIKFGLLPNNCKVVEPVYKTDFISYLINYFSKRVNQEKS